MFEEAVLKYDGDLTAHNVTFDWRFLKNAGLDLPVRRLQDTRPMCHVLEPTKTTALKPAASRHVDRRAGALQSDLNLSDDGPWTWATVPVDYEPYWTYAALDPVLTSRLQQALDPKLDATGCRRAYELELAVSFVTDQMERNGVPIDVAYAAEKFADFEGRTRELSRRCQEAFGVRPSQDNACAQRLQADGVVLTELTPTEQFKMDKAVLGGVDHPLAALILEYRRLTKLSSTYLRHFTEERMHPDINPIGARTGRMSMSKQNLQNLPRKSDASAEAIEVRNCVRAREGYTLLFCDFDQIEVRLLAHLAFQLGYPELVDAFKSPEDFFVVVARAVYDEPDFQRADLRRTTVKNFVYGGNYGAGVEKLAKTASITMAQAELVDRGLKERFPGIKAVHRGIEQAALTRLANEGEAYVTSFLTGRRHPADRDGLYTLVNYAIQGTAAELFKMKLLELDSAGLGELMIIPVHDEVVLEVPNEDLRDVAKTVQSVMRDEQLLAVPIAAGLSVGERWGQKRDYDPDQEET